MALGAAVGGFVSEHFSPRYGLAMLPIMIFFGLIVLNLGKGILAAGNNLPTEEQDLAAMDDNSDRNK
jgi:hypothetical protein